MGIYFISCGITTVPTTVLFSSDIFGTLTFVSCKSNRLNTTSQTRWQSLSVYIVSSDLCIVTVFSLFEAEPVVVMFSSLLILSVYSLSGSTFVLSGCVISIWKLIIQLILEFNCTLMSNIMVFTMSHANILVVSIETFHFGQK